MRQPGRAQLPRTRTTDAVDTIIEQWARERPDLDVAAKAVTGRVVRLADLFHQRFADVFKALGVSDGAYGVLAALRRAGEPYRLTPTELTRSLMVTSGGMTAIVDRLEQQGLVERTRNPDDRRGVLVGLTAAGRSLADSAMEAHANVEHELVASLSAQERDQLARLLSRLLVEVEPPG